MKETYQIFYVDKLAQSAWGIIELALNRYIAQQAGDERTQRICFALQGPDHIIVGEVTEAFYWNWLSFDLMWRKCVHYPYLR